MTFDDLYSYSTKNGVVIPETDNIKESVENVFKTAFGEGFSVEPETPQGRIIEAITLMFMDVLRVCAVNANGFNPSQAVGTYLDNIGALFGVARNGDIDSIFREKIVQSNSAGSGYAAALRRALSQVNGVESVCVLDNGYAYPVALPSGGENAIAVSPHSVFICVNGGDDAEVADAIFNNLSAGCGMESSSEFGTLVERDVTDESTQTTKSIKFYRPELKSVSFTATVRDNIYTGNDIVTDTQSAIREFVSGHSTNYTITSGDIISAIASYGTGIICTDLKMYSDNALVDIIAIKPNQAVAVADDAITIDVA